MSDQKKPCSHLDDSWTYAFRFISTPQQDDCLRVLGEVLGDDKEDGASAADIETITRALLGDMG